MLKLTMMTELVARGYTHDTECYGCATDARLKITDVYSEPILSMLFSYRFFAENKLLFQNESRVIKDLTSTDTLSISTFLLLVNPLCIINWKENRKNSGQYWLNWKWRCYSTRITCFDPLELTPPLVNILTWLAWTKSKLRSWFQRDHLLFTDVPCRVLYKNDPL